MLIPYTDISEGAIHIAAPDEKITELLAWILNTNLWKQYPEILYDRVTRWRKDALTDAVKLPLEPPVVVVEAPPAKKTKVAA